MKLRVQLVVAVLFFVGGSTSIAAHPGGTDEDGCHTCHTNCDKWDVESEAEHCHGDDESEDESERADDAESDKDDSEDTDESPSLDDGQRAYVEKVVDGDTLVVRPLDGTGRKVKIRILGIDCPESHKNPKCRRQGREGGPDCADQIPRGKKAAKFAADLVKQEVVRLEAGDDDGFDKGGYGRILAYIRLEDGRDLGEVLVGKGLCRNYGDKYPHPRDDAYDEAAESKN